MKILINNASSAPKKIITAAIILFLSIPLLIQGCHSGNPAGVTESDEEILEETYSFYGSGIRLEDLNGGDLYPGDPVELALLIKNSGKVPAENIRVELYPQGLIDIPTGNTSIGVEILPEGESRSLEIEGAIKVGIEEDVQSNIGFGIYSGVEEIFDGSTEINILGVREYSRNFIPIIGLHAIEDDIGIPIELSTTNFEILCETLDKFGFETVTFNQLLDHIDFGRALPEKAVIITSDDGYQDNYTNAFEVLKKYGYVMTVFLVTGAIAEDEGARMDNTVFNKRTSVSRPMLIWPEIEEMDEYGCEFLSHTVNHIRLGLAEDEEVLDELETSREDIESRLGKEVDFFAWPYDNYSEQKWPLIQESGYRGAVRYWGGIEDLRTINLNNIKRVEFNSYVSPVEYAGYLELVDIDIESKVTGVPVLEGEEFEVEYIIKNNDNMDLSISSLELELPDGIEFSGVSGDGYINQLPGFDREMFMWVDSYSIGAEGSINIKVRLIANRKGNAAIQFRVTAYGSYFNSDDLNLTVGDN